MTINLQNLIREVNTASDHVASSSEELSASSKQTGESGQQNVIIIDEMADGAEKRLQSLEMSSLSESINILVGTAHVLVEVAQQTRDGAQSVSVASEQQLASMEEIDASATFLSVMSEQLHVLIERFKI